MWFVLGRRSLAGRSLRRECGGSARQVGAAAPAVYAPAYNWTGFYLGANVGGIWGNGSTATTLIFDNAVFPTPFFPTSLGSSASSWLGGAQAGYNYQIGSAVLGVETDFDWTNLSRSGSFTSGVDPGLGTTVTVTSSARMNWLGTLRVRAGFAATADNRLLIYGTGGLAYGGVNANASMTSNGYQSIPGTVQTTRRRPAGPRRRRRICDHQQHHAARRISLLQPRQQHGHDRLDPVHADHLPPRTTRPPRRNMTDRSSASAPITSSDRSGGLTPLSARERRRVTPGAARLSLRR